MVSTRIMIVEDEAVIAMDLRKQLTRFGYQVAASAYSGAQAISEAITHKPDLIMMDIVLKGAIDGVTAAQKIKDTLDIPVIFLTAYSDPATLKRAKIVGAYGYLIKPFRPEELRSSIEVALYKHQLERRLKESEQWFAKTLHCISDAVIATDTEGKIQFMNPVSETVTGWQLNQAKGSQVNEILTILTERDRIAIENPIDNAIKSRSVIQIESPVLLLNKANHEIPIDEGAAPILDDSGKLLGAVLVFRDITARRQIESQLRESEERFHSAFDQAAVGMALVAIDGHFLQVNQSLSTIFGYTEGELLALGLHMLTNNNDEDKLLGINLRQLEADDAPSFQMELDCRHKLHEKSVWILLSASIVRNPEGQPLYFIVQFQDITERKNAEEQFIYLAGHDPLTGFLNRARFHERFVEALSSAQRHNSKLALFFIDLDRFKLINDSLGHWVGDLLLQSVSVRLNSTVRKTDILARLGGDEFLILLTDIENNDSIAKIGQNVIDTLSQPFAIEGHDIVVTASVGISVYTNDGDNGHDLLQKADTAMYKAKDQGKNNFQFYSQEMTDRSLERMNIERSLRHGLTNHGFELHFQPQINTTTGHASSAEALVRLEHPEWGLIYPERFIGVAEETGLIVPIGLWVIKAACEQIKSLQDNDETFSQIAVNVSPRQFVDPNLFISIKTTIEELGINPSSLELEITESALMNEPKQTLKVLQKLHELGIKLSIDDFGTGYSSLSYLRQFPIHKIKIDKSFIKHIPEDEGYIALVLAIITLAHQLKLTVTAEGVETLAQFEFLKKHHCDFMQGYLFSHPVMAGQLYNVLSTNFTKTIQ